jgi:hypothetical protein
LTAHWPDLPRRIRKSGSSTKDCLPPTCAPGSPHGWRPGIRPICPGVS